MTHVYALAQLLGRPGCAELADHGVAALRGRFRDDEQRRLVRLGGRRRADVTTHKAAYAHAFVVLAASSAVAAGRPVRRSCSTRRSTVCSSTSGTTRPGWSSSSGTRRGPTLDGYRGVNANMHTVEALLAAADVLGDAAWRDRALRIAHRVVHDLAPAHHWRIPEHFDASWTPLLDYNTDEPRAPVPALRRHHRALAGVVAAGPRPARRARRRGAPTGCSTTRGRAVRRLGPRGLGRRRATASSTPSTGRPPVVRERMHWVAAEATATAAALHAATGDPSYADWYDTWWDHAATSFVDPVGGPGGTSSTRTYAPERHTGRASRTSTTSSRPRCSRGFRWPRRWPPRSAADCSTYRQDSQRRGEHLLRHPPGVLGLDGAVEPVDERRERRAPQEQLDPACRRPAGRRPSIPASTRPAARPALVAGPTPSWPGPPGRPAPRTCRKIVESVAPVRRRVHRDVRAHAHHERADRPACPAPMSAPARTWLVISTPRLPRT